MPLDLRRAERFMSGFHVRSRGRNMPMRFQPNPSQRKITQQLIEHRDKGNRVYAIFLKARRLGVSTYVELMQQCHLMSKPHAAAVIMAQLATVAESLYQDAVNLSKQLPIPATAWKTTAKETNYLEVPSHLTWKTANSVKGTRGLAFTFLHSTEAAFYEDEEVFTSVLSTLSDDPENMAFIETTANGTEGPGRAYHELWEAAVEGENEFLPIFLPWHDDPEYVRPAEEAKGAPENDYERFLMKDLGLSLERIAFYRYALANKCSNRLDRWRKEYPATPKEAFEVTGMPVFDFDDMTSAEASVEDPLDVVEIILGGHRGGMQAKLEARRGARFYIYEKPKHGAHYFMGVTIGAGGEDADDTLAMVVWNGETGRLAARFVDRLHAATASELVCSLGTVYNKAMATVDLQDGGFGTQISQELRDRWQYPNPYRWKGRNDNVSASRAGKSIGFAVRDETRKMMLNGFIAALKRDEVAPIDAMLVEQMPGTQWDYSTFEANAGIDDVFWAAMLGWIARNQHHPKACDDYSPWIDDDLDGDKLRGIPFKNSPFAASMSYKGRVVDPFEGGMTLQHHLDKRDRREANMRRA